MFCSQINILGRKNTCILQFGTLSTTFHMQAYTSALRQLQEQVQQKLGFPKGVFSICLQTSRITITNLIASGLVTARVRVPLLSWAQIQLPLDTLLI